MSRQLEGYGLNILKLHAQWLLDNGYKQQATRCKMQIRMILKKQQASSNKLNEELEGLQRYVKNTKQPI